MNLSRKHLSQILFLDIETVSEYPSWNQVPISTQKHWIRKCEYLKNIDELAPSELYRHRAGIYAEFAKIICISVGALEARANSIRKTKIKSFYDLEEPGLLQSFQDFIRQHFDKESIKLCGHNLREFDIPFIVRRLLKHTIVPEPPFRLSGKKAWEIKHLIDTLDLWRFGDYKNYASLDLLCSIHGIGSSKDVLDGSMVHEYYWENEQLTEIVNYCEKDVRATMQLFIHLMRSQGWEYDWEVAVDSD